MLITLDELKTYLGIPLDNTDNDAVLGIVKASVEQSIINYCDCSFAPVVVSNEVHDGNVSDVIVPENFPVLSIQKIYLYSDMDGTNGSLLDPKNYYYKDGLIKLRYVTTPFLVGSVSISYTHGYASVPADVKLAAMQSVKAEMQRKQNNDENVTSRSKGDESESFGGAWDPKTGLPKQIVSKLAAYKSFEFGGGGMAQRNY